MDHFTKGTKALIGATVKALDDGRYRIVATTNDVDRDGDIVVPRGVSNWDEYMRNPVILPQHRWSDNPIGKAVGGEIFDDRIELDIEFAPTPLGQEFKELYDGGFMTSFSIGFIPLEHDTKGDVWLWTKWQLLEVSAVSIPANPFAQIIQNAESAGVELAAIKSLYQDATAGRQPRKRQEATDIERLKAQSRQDTEINTYIAGGR